VDEVGIERGDGPVVEALLQAEFTVLVISPNQVKNLRSRYGSAGNKDDRFEAYLLADVVRTDRRRLTPLTRSTPQTRALRSSVRARRDLVQPRVGLANQLRAHLQIVFPAAANLFAAIDSRISLAFIERFPPKPRPTGSRPSDWAHGCPPWLTAPAPPEVLQARLLAAPRGTTGQEAHTHAAVALAFVAALQTLNIQIDTLEDAIADQLDVHPDAHILTCLPRSGMLRAARLLAEIGDARGRFPTADSLACLAGVAPSTDNPARSKPSPSAGRPTTNSATHCATSPATPDTPTRGPPISTPVPEPEATTTPTPCASLAEPGQTSSGAAGKTALPTTPTGTTHSNASSPRTRPRRPDTAEVDTGQLIAPRVRACDRRARPGRR